MSRGSLAASGLTACEKTSKSGRRRACAPPPARAGSALSRPWLPPRSTSGTCIPRNSAGRVYCGYSSRPPLSGLCDSSAVLASLPSTPGKRRADPLDDRHGRHLAAGEHEVAERDLFVDERPHALVEALVAPAHERDGGRSAELAQTAAKERRPWGVKSTRCARTPPSRSSSSDSMHATKQSTRITMPEPPPYGVSSTLRWRPMPNSRGLLVRTPEDPAARPPGRRGSSSRNVPNSSGKSVTMSISMLRAHEGRCLSKSTAAPFTRTSWCSASTSSMKSSSSGSSALPTSGHTVLTTNASAVG